MKETKDKIREQIPKKIIGMVLLKGCRCRCGHEWLPREEGRPHVCPKCKSPRWDEPKKFERNPDGTRREA